MGTDFESAYNADLKEWHGRPSQRFDSNNSLGEILIKSLEINENGDYQVGIKLFFFFKLLT